MIYLYNFLIFMSFLYCARWLSIYHALAQEKGSFKGQHKRAFELLFYKADPLYEIDFFCDILISVIFALPLIATVLAGSTALIIKIECYVSAIFIISFYQMSKINMDGGKIPDFLLVSSLLLISAMTFFRYISISVDPAEFYYADLYGIEAFISLIVVICCALYVYRSDEKNKQKAKLKEIAYVPAEHPYLSNANMIYFILIAGFLDYSQSVIVIASVVIIAGGMMFVNGKKELPNITPMVFFSFVFAFYLSFFFR